ncbi:MAG TPA: ATPase, T2SS/T4P/T4SS family, partial [Gemmatimonadales bacterium]|nr:ATPase, T2SS/T4P/T4SS family [Gemmatimonadales bacterium]
MATLDKFIGVMFQQGAAHMRLASGAAVVLSVDGAERPVTREVLTKPKIMALVREIAPDGMKDHLEAESRMAFGYALDGGRVDVEIVHMGDDIVVTIGPAKPRRSSAAISMPMEARAPAAVPPAPRRAAQPSGGDAVAAAEERIQGLLRSLVESGSSDLHLRVGEPPITRKAGVLSRLEGHDPVTVEEMEALVSSIMPDRNRQEFAEINDTDFAYEILDLARFRCNVLRDRRGPAAVFRVIPTKVQTAEELGLSEEIQKLCFLTKGLVLVTGPTGSGKSTTLAA